MNKKLNKLVTNYPVELNEEEIENLSATLAPVIAACGGGGGTGGKIYTGTGFVNVNNTTNQIGLTEDANDKLNKEYVEYNEYSTAIANRYTKTQTNALLDEKQDTLEFEYDENNKVSAINGSALAGQGGGDVNYSAGIDLKIENNIISVDTNGNPNNTASNTRNFVEGSWTVASGYNSHAEGVATSALGYGVHAQGMWTKFSSSKWSDSTHEPTDIYWADGAGAIVEGYCNATTSCPMSGTIGESDYGPIHGGIIKVIGNGYRQHRLETEPAEYFPSDALIIYRDGCISAAGNISANGIELGAGGTTYQGRNGVNVDGGYVELTQTAYENVTSIPNISNDVETLKTASGDWNKVSDKLDTTAFSEVSSTFLTAHQSLDDYATKVYANNASANALSEAETWVENQHYLSAVPDEYALKDDIPTTVAQLTDSGNYYTKNQTSGATELSTEFAKYVTSSDITTQDTNYVMTTTGWKVLTLPGGGMTQVIHDETLTGQGNADNSKLGVAWSALSGNTINSAKSATVATEYYDAEQTNTFNIAESMSSKVDKPTSLTNKYLVLRTDNVGNVSGWSDLQEQCYSKTEATGTFIHRGMLDNGTGGTLTGTGLTGGTVLGVNTNVIQTKLTDEQLSAIGEVSSKLDRADLDDYVPYSATKLAIGSSNNISENNSDNSFAQGTNNKVSTSPYSFVQGEANSAVNYYSLAQGYGNYAQAHALAQGTNNHANTVSLTQGQNNSATTYSFAQGTENSAVTTSFAQGSANKARYDSFAQGNRNSAFSQSFAQGHYNSADDGSLAQGKHNTAYSHSFAQGSMNYADNNALAQGGDNTAKYFSQALGFGLSIQGSRGHEDGTDYISGGLAIGTYNQTSSNVAFVIGNGHSNGREEPTRSDAFIIYPDGRVSAAGKISANGVELGAGGTTLTLPVNVGTGNNVTQTSAIGAIGNNCSAGTKSFAFSYKGATAANNSFAVNDDNVADHNSFAWGSANTADNYSMAGGTATSADEHSFALGNAVYTKYWTLGIGRGLEFSGDSNATTGIGALVAGGWNKTTSNAIFVLGNGTGNGSYRRDAVVVERSGNTKINGSLTVDVSSGKNVLAVASAATLIGASRQTTEHYGVDNTAIGTTWMGVGGDGMNQGFIKYTNGGNVGDLDTNSTIQLNFKPSTNNFDSVQVQINGNSVGYLIPAVTSTTTAGLTNDGILHIIIES